MSTTRLFTQDVGHLAPDGYSLRFQAEEPCSSDHDPVSQIVSADTDLTLNM